MKRRQVLGTGLGAGWAGAWGGAGLPWLSGVGAAWGASALAGCQPVPTDLAQRLAHVRGGFAGADMARGHVLRDAAGGRKSGSAPAPAVVRRVHTVIAGGGVAGLAAARALRLRGQDDVALLELEDEAGGNARGSTLGGLACPLGAHYLPVPGDHNPDLQHLLEELGLRRREAGRWVYDERALCHSPQERLYFQGHWQPGLLPTEGVGPDTLAQYRRFAALVAQAQQTGRYQIPHVLSMPENASAHVLNGVDALTLSDYLQKNGLNDPHLHWYLDYCCRDDYGAGTATVSAWAGLHYFAARHGFAVPGGDAGRDEAEREAVLTWPEGNAWLTRRLAQPLGERLHTGCVVQRVEVGKHGVAVDALDTRSGQPQRWLARQCVVALPLHVAARVVVNPPDALRAAAQHTPHAAWVVTNLHLSEPLADRGGASPAWDNVLYGSAGLGYVNAGHQALYVHPRQPVVLSHYRALGAGAAQRADLMAQAWSHWLHQTVAELLPAHPELPQRITQASVARFGHAMAVPTPGVLGEITRQRSFLKNSLLSINSRLRFAHSDWAGYSVLEEAFALGHAAGQAPA